MKFYGAKDEVFQKEAEAAIQECVAVVQERGWFEKYENLAELLANLEVEFSNRLTTTAGRAISRLKLNRGVMKLNYRLLKENFNQIRATVRHELAHIVVHGMYKQSCGHDLRWKTVAMAFGDDGERCHTMNVEALRAARKPQKKYAWMCLCDVHVLSAQKHARLQKNVSHYGHSCAKCRSCQTNVVYKGAQ